MGCSSSNIIEYKEAQDILKQKEDLIDYFEKLSLVPSEKDKNKMMHYDIDFSEQISKYTIIQQKKKSNIIIKQIALLKKHFRQLSIRWKYITGNQMNNDH